MHTYDLNEKSRDGKVYYDVILDTVTNNVFMAKNTGWDALLEKFLSVEFNLPRYQVSQRFKCFFNLTDSEPNQQRIPKKYHKLIFTK